MYALDMSRIQYAGEEGIVATIKARDLVKYMAPAPPAKTGKHRYVFVLLEPEVEQESFETDAEAPTERPYGDMVGLGQVS